jgi:FtsP/CotA-like multicopper oxidase with cupredoxin domain
MKAEALVLHACVINKGNLNLEEGGCEHNPKTIPAGRWSGHGVGPVRWAGGNCRCGSGTQVDEYSLRVDYSVRELGPFRLRTRTYNSSLPGPLMVTRPGHTLHVKLMNHLRADPSALAPAGVDPLNNPHAFNTTNLHMHGLQVIPHLFQQLGTLILLRL